MSPSPSTQDAESHDSPPSPLPSPPPEASTATRRLFAPTLSSSPSPQESTSPQSPNSPDSPSSWTDAPAPLDSGPDASGATPSTGKGLKLSKASLRTALGAGFRQASKVLAAFVAIEEERDLGVWAPDEEDVADVSQPAANLVYRRLPDDAKSGDLIDLFALGTALVAYFAKNLQRRAIVRTHLRLQAEQGIDVTGGEPQG